MNNENMKALDMGVNYLSHHGIIGQKWGVRRYQNADGTWTKEGLERRREMDDLKCSGYNSKGKYTRYEYHGNKVTVYGKFDRPDDQKLLKKRLDKTPSKDSLADYIINECQKRAKKYNTSLDIELGIDGMKDTKDGYKKAIKSAELEYTFWDTQLDRGEMVVNYPFNSVYGNKEDVMPFGPTYISSTIQIRPDGSYELKEDWMEIDW